jgi:Effector Associated Constant Component 1
MDILVKLSGESVGTDDLRALHAWLVADDVLGGYAETVMVPAEPGTLGSVLDALRIAGDPAGATVAWALVTWLRNQRHDVTLRVTKKASGTTATYSGKRLRKADHDQIRSEIAELAVLLGEDTDGG